MKPTTFTMNPATFTMKPTIATMKPATLSALFIIKINYLNQQ